MATIKSYTDLQQSRKLEKILPLESADMHYVLIDTEEDKYGAGLGKCISILPHYPCWSLAALLDILQYPILFHNGDKEWGCTVWIDTTKPYSILPKDSPIDACYAMIIRLHELNLL